MTQTDKLKEGNKNMKNEKIILQLAQLLEKKELISANERMKMSDIIRKGQ